MERSVVGELIFSGESQWTSGLHNCDGSARWRRHRIQITALQHTD